MIIYQDTFKVFHLYSKLGPLPQFDCMSSLDASVYPSDLEWLPTFLECCPNLESLVLTLDAYLEKINSKEMN
ncbi:hypothetical protein AALP_AA8G319500 [Arabis alpina]|uniref:FBD domain-containing protein n=1 Tax=Arabis alpina TaxID=50452 RepID=A0A087GAT4_ARAAL|nr:hypothetical protein AALP_AA8G319500 [Arabis alpina]